MVPTFAAADAEQAVAQASGAVRAGLRPSCSRSCRATSFTNPMSAASCSISPVPRPCAAAAADILARAKTLRPEARISGVDRAGDGAAAEGARTHPRPRRRSDLRHRRRVRPRRHRGRDHQRQGAGAAAARPATGPRPDRAHPRLPAAARLPRRAGGEARRGRHGAGQAGADGRRPSRDPRTRHQSAAGRRSGRAGRRRARRGRAGGAKIRRLRPGQFRGAALSVAMAAAPRGQGWLAGLCAPDPARGRAADPRIPASCHAARICGCASSRR